MPTSGRCAGFFCCTWLLFATACASGEVTPYPSVPGDHANADYVSVKVDGTPVSAVTTDMAVGYTHFAFSGAVTVEITAKEPIQTFDLSPHRLAIPATVDGNTLRFQLAKPAKLHLRINGLSRFFVFAEAPEVNPPQPGQAGVMSLADAGVASSADEVQTKKLQAAIDAAAEKKRVLYVPPGIYRAGRLDLKSGTRLYLAPGAVIKGTGNAADYPRAQGGLQQIRIGEASDVQIFGRGVIDGYGQAMRRAGDNKTESKAKLLVTFKAENVKVSDVILRGAGVWCAHLIESNDLTFDNVKLISLARSESAPGEEAAGNFYGGNTDGFDPDNSSRVVIQNNFISVDDDAIAVKLTGGTRRDMQDIQFRDNVIWTMCSALKIGTEIRDKTLSNVVFENNDIVHADVGIAVWCWRGGTVDGARWENNHFERVGAVRNESPHKKESNIRLTIRDVEGKGQVHNLVLKDNTFETFSPNDSLIQGLDAEHIFDGVTIENLLIAGKRRVNADDARLTLGRFAENVTMR